MIVETGIIMIVALLWQINVIAIIILLQSWQINAIAMTMTN